MAQLPPSQSIDDDHISTAGPLTFNPNTRKLHTFSNVVWQEQHHNSWVSEVQQDEADFGPWRVDLEGDNRPTVAAGLRKMGTDVQ